MGGTESKARSKTGDPLVAIMQGYKFDRSKGTDFKRWNRFMKHLNKHYTESGCKLPWFRPVYKKYEELQEQHDIKQQHEIIHLPQNKTVFSEADEKDKVKRAYGEQKLSELLVLDKVEIEGNKVDDSEEFNKLLMSPKAPESTTSTQQSCLGPSRRSTEELSSTMGFLIKFSSIIAENSAVQFSVLVHVLELVSRQMKHRTNIFTALFKAFLQKFFLIEVAALEENLKLSQSQSTEGSRPGASIGKGNPPLHRVNRLVREVRRFFQFLGNLAVEYYCLDMLSFRGLNDIGYKIKIEPCVFLTGEILGDFFAFMFYEKYMSANLTDLIQRRHSVELENMAKRFYEMKDMSSAELNIPLEAFPDYSVLQTIINDSMGNRNSRGRNSKKQPKLTQNQSANSYERAEPGAISSSLSSEPQMFKETIELLPCSLLQETEGARLDRQERVSVTSRQSNVSSTCNEKLKGDLLSNASQRHIRTASANNSMVKGLCVRPKKYINDHSRLLQEEPKMFDTVLSDSGLNRGKQLMQELRSKQGKLSKYSPKKQKSTKLLSTLQVLTLQDQLTILDILNRRGSSKPFMKSIAILQRIQFIDSPLSKLECVYDTLASAIVDIRDFYATVNRNFENYFVLSKENMQAIFTYITLKARVSNLSFHMLVIRELIASRGLIDTDRICGLLRHVVYFVGGSELGS